MITAPGRSAPGPPVRWTAGHRLLVARTSRSATPRPPRWRHPSMRAARTPRTWSDTAGCCSRPRSTRRPGVSSSRTPPPSRTSSWRSAARPARPAVPARAALGGAARRQHRDRRARHRDKARFSRAAAGGHRAARPPCCSPYPERSRLSLARQPHPPRAVRDRQQAHRPPGTRGRGVHGHPAPPGTQGRIPFSRAFCSRRPRSRSPANSSASSPTCCTSSGTAARSPKSTA